MRDAGVLHRHRALAPADAAGDLFDQQSLDLGRVGGHRRGDVGEQRQAQRARRGLGQCLGHRIGGGGHQRAVERRRDGQRDAALDAVLLDQRDRAIDRRLVAREHDLTRIVIVGDGADLALGRRLGQRLRLVDVGAEQRAHRAHAHRHRRLHRLAAQLEQPRGVGQAERAHGAERGIFAQAVARDEIGLGGEIDAAVLLQHPQHRDGMRHDRRLRVGGERQDVLGAFAHDRREPLAERVVDFLEDLARGDAGFGELRAHAHLLATLSREYECPHRDPSPPLLSAARAVRNAERRWQARTAQSCWQHRDRCRPAPEMESRGVRTSSGRSPPPWRRTAGRSRARR